MIDLNSLIIIIIVTTKKLILEMFHNRNLYMFLIEMNVQAVVVVVVGIVYRVSYDLEVKKYCVLFLLLINQKYEISLH